jgi:hypothetical protein
MLRRRADLDPAITCQLAAVKFYLRDIIQTCDNEWKKLLGAASNYSGFLDEIESWRQSTTNVKEIFLVTFNYDTLLEDALTRSLRITKRFNTIADYILGPYKVFKLHGSINWGHKVSKLLFSDQSPNSVDEVNHLIIRNIAVLETRKCIAKDIHLFSGYSTSEWFMPALSIPVEHKAESECPEGHRQALLDFLPHVEMIIAVGWRAMEDSFVRQLAKSVRTDVNTLVISRNQQSASTIADRLRDNGFPGKVAASPAEGFTAATRKLLASDFLVDSYRGEYRKGYSGEV